MQTTDADNFFRAEADLKGAQARELKAERTKDIGEPIDLGSKIISLVVRGQNVWTAESSKVVRRIDLNLGKTLQVYKGHTGPVTCFAFYDTKDSDGSSETFLIMG
ncbi:hypothetical protein FRC01_004860 [Tulasnella sp. 417]|nr:hypothetical protein FRC01_004860 [Tulasnella sp. 417]